MYVKTTRDDRQAISLPGMEHAAEFSENQIARVTEADGGVLLDEFPEEFSEHTTEDSDSNED